MADADPNAGLAAEALAVIIPDDLVAALVRVEDLALLGLPRPRKSAALAIRAKPDDAAILIPHDDNAVSANDLDVAALEKLLLGGDGHDRERHYGMLISEPPAHSIFYPSKGCANNTSRNRRDQLHVYL